MVLRVCVDMPELLPLPLPAWDRLGVGVLTETEVELLTEPSEAVSTTTVVEVTGVALAVVELASAEVVLLSVAEGDCASEVVCVGAFWLVVLVVGAASSDVVVVWAGAVVVSLVVVGVSEVVGAAVVSVVAVVVWLVVSAGVEVAATVFAFPLASAALLAPESCLNSSSLPCLPRMAASMMKAWLAVEADNAATSSFSILAECILL